ncbi:hypothetical protein C7M71_014505 [Peterkaempfera bronchialis]|uniref:Uncharacterized protein n=1 Tax=Peterkaempfera bronchialis TaxID=2126346 RepID=A0A345SXK7_9ACTN|nr:hypothetical protein C7M71_014505 [Peterkaempfera bronchialis]
MPAKGGAEFGVGGRYGVPPDQSWIHDLQTHSELLDACAETHGARVVVQQVPLSRALFGRGHQRMSGTRGEHTVVGEQQGLSEDYRCP